MIAELVLAATVAVAPFPRFSGVQSPTASGRFLEYRAEIQLRPSATLPSLYVWIGAVTADNRTFIQDGFVATAHPYLFAAYDGPAGETVTHPALVPVDPRLAFGWWTFGMRYDLARHGWLLYAVDAAGTRIDLALAPSPSARLMRLQLLVENYSPGEPFPVQAIRHVQARTIHGWTVPPLEHTGPGTVTSATPGNFVVRP